MKKDTLIIILILGFAFLFVGASALYNYLGDKVEHESLVTENEEDSSEDSDEPSSDNSENPPEKPKKPAPNFTVFDIDKNPLRLSDFRDKPIIINFWASWCGPCRSEMPDFQKVYDVYKDKINFMFINITDESRETMKKASSYIASQKYTFPVYYDITLSASSNYNTSSIPATYFIDAEGNIAAWAQGALNMSAIEQGISMIYSE